jgi:hypothetical protein
MLRRLQTLRRVLLGGEATQRRAISGERRIGRARLDLRQLLLRDAGGGPVCGLPLAPNLGHAGEPFACESADLGVLLGGEGHEVVEVGVRRIVFVLEVRLHRSERFADDVSRPVRRGDVVLRDLLRARRGEAVEVAHVGAKDGGDSFEQGLSCGRTNRQILFNGREYVARARGLDEVET